MGLTITLGSLLFFFWISGIWAGFAQENCANYELQFERVFSVPGEVAMLNSTLLSPDVLNFTTIPYNITWYNLKTGQEMKNQTGQTLVVRETLWFLNTTLDDAGEYVMILRTISKCYMQSTKLEVNLPVSGECGRPLKTCQDLTKGVSDILNCPLKDYIDKLESYNIPSSLKWYKGCDPILDGENGYTYIDSTKLIIAKVETENSGFYTCTLTFSLSDVEGSVSETIDATVRDKYSLVPEVHEPANETIKAEKGSIFTTRCLVFVPGVGEPIVHVFWLVRDNFIDTNPSAHIYTSEQRLWRQDEPKGVWLERWLMISELRAEDFNINYTCRAYSFRGNSAGYFTLLTADPNIILPIGLVFGSATVLFIISVIIYYIFRIEIVLWFRRTFPVLYTNKDWDGKLYDAYVTYPQPDTCGFSEEVERFALHTLPEVLEKACGYKLFIAGRDCLPGQAIVDSVDENIKSSRRFLLLYTASTFISKRHTSSVSSNNNNVSKNSDGKIESKTSDGSSLGLDGGDKVFSDTRQYLECVAAMHRALLEGSLKVVLVELEEITPAQLALFPESVLHLRKKQGAVCWWKNLQKTQGRRTCVRWREGEQKGGEDSPLSPSLSPSSRFWKEMRYHMPVRGKRVVSAEKNALLNL
ncbi:interleukin-1 receptor type 1 [Kryptolebias marmoratus]|uniref:Zmp:0000000936 n=1 Tax=Kryptolebias marmoratus TaxID=37003 RepID=A0A3Q3AMT4_KRYMA|nr:interleukin-1 receptor type 1 [Kryptolebias marmoratus]XP_017285670.1 interleukin-1 receptor type 1 [Kryptolebias marmoratus]